MSSNSRSRPPIGQQKVTPARARKAPARPVPAPVAPKPEEVPHYTADAPDPVIQQAKRDIDAGQVDTDMRATPGLDAAKRGKLVPGPAGSPSMKR